MKNGDLVAEHFSYIRAGVRSRAAKIPYEMDRDDIVGFVFVRIVNEAQHYDPARGTFKTWLKARVNGGVADAVRVWSPSGRRKHQVRVDQLKNPHLIVAAARTPNGARRLVSEAMAEMPERLRDVLQMRFYQGLTFREIAATLGVSNERGWQLFGDAVERMRKILARRGVRKVGDVI
jgi:RNA polymerase sigma factor (sigma-70 family)